MSCISCCLLFLAVSSFLLFSHLHSFSVSPFLPLSLSRSLALSLSRSLALSSLPSFLSSPSLFFFSQHRYISLRDAFNVYPVLDDMNASTSMRPTFQIGRVRTSKGGPYVAAMTCESHQGVRLWKRYLGHDSITGSTPVYLE